jgi:hypothetical protein
MKGFASFPALAGALAALGLIGGAARAEFLTEAKAVLNTKSDLAGSVAGSDITLTASYAPAAGEAGGPVTYTWTLGFAQPGPGLPPGGTPSYSLSTDVTGGVSLGAQVPTAPGFTEPVVGFFTLGPTVYFQLSGAITPSGGDAVGSYNVAVDVNTASGSINIDMVPIGGPGPVTLPGGFTPVPEPATVALLGVGGLLLLVPRLRRRLRRERVTRA